MATGYTKLFGSLIGSTIWREPDHVRLVWITMLALKNRHQVVEASVPGLADFARVPLAKCLEALKVLREPDEYSRSKENDGRRIQDIDGGWLILNGEKYRDKMGQDERREANKIYQRRFRERMKEKEKKKAEAEKAKLDWGKPSPGEISNKKQFEAGSIDEYGQPILPSDMPTADKGGAK